MLIESGLISRYPLIPCGLRSGFSMGIPPLKATFNPPNYATIDLYPDEYEAIIAKEFIAGRYLGPYTRIEVEFLLGPFQSSPLSLTPKPHKPKSLRLIQNLSYPRLPNKDGFCSINSTIDSSLFPFTWGTFSATSLLISSLPPGSQGACRDISEAFRSIPLHPSQWPGVVVRLSNTIDSYAIDTCDMFGAGPGPGLHGRVADAGADLMRYRGMGPLVKWVDDHCLFRILRQYLVEYNNRREAARRRIAGPHHIGGRIWYSGALLPDDSREEFTEPCEFPLQDLSGQSTRSAEDALYTYCFADVDALSADLGYIWNLDKDVPFSTTVPFTGFEWHLESRTVSIAATKREKYRAAIAAFVAERRHNLSDVRKLYGKLLHASAVVPAGRAYLTRLEAFMSAAHNSPHVLHSTHRDTPRDLGWWDHRLSSQSLCTRRIPAPVEVFDVGAFSDASSGFGIAVVIHGWWRAWRLVGNWRSQGDIQWAEAVGFELLTLSVVALASTHQHFKVFCDNTAVVEGWHKHSSRNTAVNTVFRRVHTFLEQTNCVVHTRYVICCGTGAQLPTLLRFVSGTINPADGPSRGIYLSSDRVLPPIALPDAISPFLVDVDVSAPPEPGLRASFVRKDILDAAEIKRRADFNCNFERFGSALLHDDAYWWDLDRSTSLLDGADDP